MMKRIDVIPRPNKCEFLKGSTEINPDELVCELDDSLGEEEYILTVTKDELKIRGGSPKAVFYGKKSLEQLDKKSKCLIIEDKPAFSYRGFMLDCARHMFEIDDIKKMIDAAASVKMNVMHWHLADDQGFRMWSERRPSAAIDGSVRRASRFGNLIEEGSYGGYYTAEQMKEIVAYCAERYITVVPEFDIPGHSSALLHVYPDISCKKEPVEVKTCQGIFEDVICPGKDKSFEVVLDIIDDMLDIFPGELIHIGGDEVPKKNWKKCPDCQQRIKNEGLENEEQLQGWFTNRIADYIRSKGRTPIVWNESLRSGLLKNNTVVQMWMDPKKHSVAFANEGGKIIVSDFYHYYCDYPYAMTPLFKTYKYNPVLKGIKNSGNVLGVESPVWTEYINNFEKLSYMCFPRFTATAESGWTEDDNKSPSDFLRRFRVYSDYLRSIGIEPAPEEDWNPSLGSRLKGTVNFFNKTVRVRPPKKDR